MADVEPRYSFDPLDRRGVLLGLQPVHLVTLAVAGLVAIGAARLGGHGGPVLAVAAFVAVAALGMWPRRGRPISAWLAEVVPWLVRRARGPSLYDGPLEGTGTRHGIRSPRGQRVSAAGPGGVDLIELESLDETTAIGALVDRRSGSWSAVMRVTGRPLSLLDPHDQARALDGWRVTLNSTGRPGTAVRRLQWVQRSRPEDPALPSRLEPGDDARLSNPAVSYAQLLKSTAPAQLHESWLVVAVSGPASLGSTARRAEQTLRRELRLLEGQLRSADLGPSAPLSRDEISVLVRSAHDPCGPPPAVPCARAWAVAEEESWSWLRVDASWHATYWIADWPRVDVRPDFLAPLLLCEGNRTVSVVMSPVPPDRALREVRSARTADAADEQLRSRAGFMPSARRNREAEGVARREEELADGHAEYRFSGYVTVHGPDCEGLKAACAEVEHAAQASHVDLRRLFGRQREAFTWTLPLARGLR